MIHDEIRGWLAEIDEKRLEELWHMANVCREENVGDEVHLRGLVEFSNYCVRECWYCGLQRHNKDVERYRMPYEDIWECVELAVQYGYGTVVLQSGEDMGITKDWMADIVRRIKEETPLAVTLSLGEREPEELEYWKEAGADRYLLRFETSNQELYNKIHPSRPDKVSDRIEFLRMLKRLGYETGSGVLIGIPSQTYDDLAKDIELFAELDLDMIGVGPFIPHDKTPLGKGELVNAPESDQVPSNEFMTYKVVALSRIVCPLANIPSTTALATLNLAQGRELGLERGANVVMPNLTQPKYRAKYEIYPSKACIYESAGECHNCMRGRIHSIGRTIGTGRGDSPNIKKSLTNI